MPTKPGHAAFYHHVRLSMTNTWRQTIFREDVKPATLRKLWSSLLLTLVQQWGFQQDFHDVTLLALKKGGLRLKKQFVSMIRVNSAFIPSSSESLRHSLFLLIKLLNKNSLSVCKWVFFFKCTTFTWIVGWKSGLTILPITLKTTTYKSE